MSVLGAPLYAQSGAGRSDGIQCSQCTVQSRLIATLGRAADPVLLDIGSFAVRDSQGRYYVAEPAEFGVVLAYDANGAYMRKLGRRGDGPGELTAVTSMAIGPGDSLYVFGTRLTVFSPLGVFARTAYVLGAAAPVNEALVLDDGRLVAQAMIHSAELIGLPLHIVDREGAVRRSIGDADAEAYVESFPTSHRRIAKGQRGTFWSADLNRLRLQQWDANGRRVAVIEPRLPWFAPWDPVRETATRPWDVRPPPMVLSVSLDSVGRLWVAVTVADSKWRRRSLRRGPGKPMTPGEMADLLDTMILALDPRTGRVIHEQRFPNKFKNFVGPAMISEMVEDDDGVISLRVWQLTLTSGSGDE